MLRISFIVPFTANTKHVDKLLSDLVSFLSSFFSLEQLPQSTTAVSENNEVERINYLTDWPGAQGDYH